MKMTQLDIVDSCEKGGYILLLDLEEVSKIQIGRLGEITFDSGYYAYVGSAMRGLKQRILRHLRREKTFHWHIDYFLEKASVSNVIVCRSENNIECLIAYEIGKEFKVINGFGSSDCNCSGHLYHSTFDFNSKIMRKLGSTGMKPFLIPVG
jgi:Uri superfamily endonuclease